MQDGNEILSMFSMRADRGNHCVDGFTVVLLWQTHGGDDPVQHGWFL